MKQTIYTSLRPATRRLCAALCLLVCVYGLSFLYNPSRTQVFSSSLIQPLDVREVQEIVFSIPEKAEPIEMGLMTLTKRGDRFFLQTEYGRYPVREEYISRFLSLLSSRRSFLTVSTKPQDYPAYGIEDARAAKIHLVRKDKTLLAELFFGTSNAAGTGQYVRTGRSVKVFLIDNGIESFLTVSAPFWLDLQIYQSLFQGTGIQGLEHRNNTILRDEENDADFRALELFLKTYSCIDVYSAAALQNPQTEQVRLTLGDGSALTFSFSPLESGDYVFFDTRSSTAYLISGYTCKQLIRHIEALTKEKNVSF